ncbi:hypothetical protein M079_0493 [Bacteroides fragilis str. 3996 N(B) 6]|nr:hypothetical protein M079_0493 [Bacteroides fragilis str. 3996 N(B) 6]EYA26665.1 hypothetical protein M103_0574 [Bacteroides fragilis str. 1007-1-F \
MTLLSNLVILFILLIKKKEEQSEQILSEWLFFLYFNHQKNQFYFPVSQ